MNYIIGLDIGDKRIGIAISDSMGLGVRAHDTVNIENFMEFFSKLIEEYCSQEIIVGLPKHKDGTDSEQTTKVRDYVAKLAKSYPKLDFKFENEILTSSEAKSRLKERGIKLTEANKGLIDSEAAAIILEQYFSDL